MIRRRRKKRNELLRNESKQTRSIDGFLMDFGGTELLIMNPLCRGYLFRDIFKIYFKDFYRNYS